MIEYDEALYNVTVNDDGTYPPDATEPSYGGGEGSKKINLADVCQQFNFTEEDDEEE